MAMNLLRLMVAVMISFCVLPSNFLAAQVVSPPFAMDKQYSAELMVMMKDGTTFRGKSFIDGDKLRSNMTVNGMDTVIIIRKDLLKIWMVLDAQKLVMEAPYDPAKFKGQAAASFGPEGKFEVIGPESMDGIPCTKYKVTSLDGKNVVFFWLDLQHKVPVRMEAEDHAYILKWRDYQTGPQDSALFELPANYQVMDMPEIPGLSGGSQ